MIRKIFLTIHRFKCVFWNEKLLRLQKAGILEKSYPEEFKKWKSEKMSHVSKGGRLSWSHMDFRFWLYMRKIEGGIF